MTIVAIGGGHSLEAGAAASFARILALRPGVLAKVNSAYRSNDQQAALRTAWEVYQAGGPWAAIKAALIASGRDKIATNANLTPDEEAAVFPQIGGSAT